MRPKGEHRHKAFTFSAIGQAILRSTTESCSKQATRFGSSRLTRPSGFDFSPSESATTAVEELAGMGKSSIGQTERGAKFRSRTITPNRQSELLLDNAEALVNFHDAQTREILSRHYWRSSDRTRPGAGAAALRPLDGRSSFQPIRECGRRVQLTPASNSKPTATTCHGGGSEKPSACFGQRAGSHRAPGLEVHTRLAASAAHRRAHLLGIVGTETRPQPYATQVFPVAPPELLRPLHEAARYLPLSLVTGSQPLEFPGPLREDSTRRRDLQTLLRGNSKASLGCVDGTPGSE